MKKQYVLIAVTMILLFGIGSAFGQEVSDEAKRHFDRGMAALEMAKSPNDYAAAISEFEQAARLAPDWPAVYYNLGKVQEAAEKYGDAIRSFREYLRLAPDAEDAEEIKSLINKLEYKAEQVLTIPQIIDVLTDFFDIHSRRWDFAVTERTEDRKPNYAWTELILKREGVDTVKALKGMYSYPTRLYYQTLKITGPQIKYVTTANVCEGGGDEEVGNCDSVVEHEIEVVSRKLVKVSQTVLRGGFGNGTKTGDRYACTFTKKDDAGSPEIMGENKPAALARRPAGGSDVDEKDFSGWTALMRACRGGDQKEVEQLIAKGADVNATEDNHGTTPLFMAVASGSKEIVELLIAKGADVSAKANDGARLLHKAAAIGSKEIIELLLAKGADINAKDSSGNTPLHETADSYKRESAEFLIAKGADVNAKTKTGNTPLLLAAVFGRKDIVELLITKGADINAPNEDGLTPLQAAIERGNNDVAEVLRKHGAR